MDAFSQGIIEYGVISLNLNDYEIFITIEQRSDDHITFT